MSSPGASGTGAVVSVAGVRGRRIRQVETGADSAGPCPGSSTGTTDGLRVLRRLGTSPCSGGPAGVSPEPKTSRRRGQLRSRRHACRTSGLRERRGQRGGRSGRRQASALLAPGATNHPTALRDPDLTSVPGVRRYSRYRSRVSSGVSLEDPAAVHGADGDRIARRPDSVSETAPSGAWGVWATGSVESLPERESGGDLVSVGGLDGTPPAPERGRVGIRQGSADLLARLTRAVAMKNQRVEFWRRCCHNASQNGDRA